MITAIGDFFTNKKKIAGAQASADQYDTITDATSANTFGTAPIFVKNEEEARIAANQGLKQDPNNPLMFRSPYYENMQLWSDVADTKVDNALQERIDYLDSPVNTVIDRAADILNLPFSIVGQGRVIPDPSAKSEKRYNQALEDNTKIARYSQETYTGKREAVNKTLSEILAQKKQYSGIGSVQPVGKPQPSLDGLYQPMSDGSVRQYMQPDGTPFKPTKQQLVDLGGGLRGIIDVNDPTPTPNEVVDQDTYTENLRVSEQAKKEGAETGKAIVNLRTQMPIIKDNINNTLQVINELKNHVGKKKVVGSIAGNYLADSVLGIGSDEADFKTKLDRLKGQLFLAVRESLKGAGQVTDFEGTKGEQSVSDLNMTNSLPAFDQNLDSLEAMLIRTLKVKQNQLDGYSTTQGGNTYQVVE
jgi:hypothetical protein